MRYLQQKGLILAIGFFIGSAFLISSLLSNPKNVHFVQAEENLDNTSLETNLDDNTQNISTLSSTDNDGDGLIDEIENEYGTNPQSSDTDGDGYTDGLEIISGYSPLGKGKLSELSYEKLSDKDKDGIPSLVEAYYGTDPFIADSDGDGLTDGYETKNGLDPLNKDTDNDTYEDGVEIMNGYSPFGKGYIAQLDKKIITLQACTEFAKSKYNIDINQLGNIINTTPTTSTQTPPPSIPSPDTQAESNIKKGDTDGDGLLDSDELIIGTDPKKKDSDGDGMSDYDELSKGTNPLKK